MTAVVHPLFGRLLAAAGFKRWDGALLLVVTLPDGSPGTIPADATNVFGDAPGVSPARSVLTVEGVRQLRRLMEAARPPRRRSRPGSKTCK